MKKKVKTQNPESIQGRKGYKRMNSPDVPGGNRAESLAELQPHKVKKHK